MRLLLDTHAFLWFVTEDEQLSPMAHALIADPGNEVFLSPASFWEVAIKVSVGKYPLVGSFTTFFDEAIEDNDFEVLPVELRHAAEVATLPFPQGHKDPFDRMIVAQAIVEGLPLVSADRQLDNYPVQRLW